MGRTSRADSLSGSFHIGNGSTMPTPIFPLIDPDKFARISDFFIQAPNVKIDPDVKKIVEQESNKLRYKTLKYSGKNEDDWTLFEILRSQDGTKDNAKAKLTKDGKSAVISEVSKDINLSSIDHSTKFLLSHEPFYVYALSYGIYYEGVKDAEGLNDRVILATENNIKKYINAVLAKKVIKERHLDLDRSQTKKILHAASNSNFSYLKGEPMKAISKIISKYVVYGDLHALVDKFFESGEIDPEKGTPQIRQLMVNYLMDIGLTLPPPESEDRPEEPQIESTESSAGNTTMN